jgi:xylan 1,4-beta-xylosidase
MIRRPQLCGKTGGGWLVVRKLIRSLAVFLCAFGLTAGEAAAEPAQVRTIEVDVSKAVGPLDRSFNFSVGSDYPGTLSRPDSLAQLKTAVDELGFRYIRFHAIFHDVLGTVKVVDGKTVYDWTKIDQLYDAFRGMGIRPFVELGFTPQALKTSDNKIFYWNGNTSHPKPQAWHDLIDAFVRHLESRYGKEEVRRWYFEVWNEPNLNGFWEKADKQAYFDLYENSARKIKAVDPELKVGGPSTAGAAWVPEFLEFAASRNVPIDFVSTHTYGVDGGFLDEKGQDDNKLSTSPDSIIGDVRRVREQITASKFPNLPLYFTEWSTSYNPRDPVHDSYISAAYILTKLKAARAYAQGMSYWTYSDLFEEPGPPPTPFHGGFGLMNREGIRKASWFAYKYLNLLGGREVPSNDTQPAVFHQGSPGSAIRAGERAAVTSYPWPLHADDPPNGVPGERRANALSGNGLAVIAHPGAAGRASATDARPSGDGQDRSGRKRRAVRDDRADANQRCRAVDSRPGDGRWSRRTGAMTISRRAMFKGLLAGAVAEALPIGRTEAAAAKTANCTQPVAKTKPRWGRGFEGQRKADLGDGNYLNPIIPGDHPDPTVLKDGDDYYMTFSSFVSYPGVIIWHSRDLVNWSPIGPALMKPLGSIWAMDLTRHNGRYFIYIPAVPFGENAQQGVFVIWADDIRGPWSDPIDLKLPGCIDPGHAVGEDGKRYLFVNGIRKVRLTDDGLATDGKLEPAYQPWQYPKDWVVEMFAPEGPKIIRRGSYFYLVTAVGGTSGPPTSHMVIGARSKSIHGPWEHCPNNPTVKTQSEQEPWWSRGHASLVEGPADDWWMIYHGYENGLRTLGRQTLLEPIEWTADGWFRARGSR